MTGRDLPVSLQRTFQGQSKMVTHNRKGFSFQWDTRKKGPGVSDDKVFASMRTCSIPRICVKLLDMVACLHL